MKYVVFGDTGGHGKQLFTSLKTLGVDLKNFIIPDNLTIIHLGDLIHKGPNSKAILDTVDKLITNNPGKWRQILGNHEFNHIPGAPIFWRCDCDEEDIAILQKWYREGLATPTFGLDNIVPPNLEVTAKPKLVAANSSWFFSHGGLTFYWWEAMGSPNSAVQAAELFNELDVREVTLPGAMLGMPQFKAGPVWAIGNDEVWNSWKGNNEIPPFSQMHGHTTSYLWNNGRWWDSRKTFKPFRDASKVNPETRAVITDLGDNNLMVGIDPGYNKIATTATQPYIVLEDTSF
jgi:hypothetical protein